MLIGKIICFISGEDQAEVHLMSNINSDIKTLVPYNEALQAWLRQLVEDIMDQQLVMSDVKPRHIFNKALEVRNIKVCHISIVETFSYQ